MPFPFHFFWISHIVFWKSVWCLVIMLHDASKAYRCVKFVSALSQVQNLVSFLLCTCVYSNNTPLTSVHTEKNQNNRWTDLLFFFPLSLIPLLTLLQRQTDRRQDGYTGGGCARRLGGRLVEDVVRSRWEGWKAAQGDIGQWRWGRERGSRRSRGRSCGDPLPWTQRRRPGQSEQAAAQWPALWCAPGYAGSRVPSSSLRPGILQFLLPQALHFRSRSWPTERLQHRLCGSRGSGSFAGLCLHSHIDSQSQQCGWHSCCCTPPGNPSRPGCLYTPAGHQSALPAGTTLPLLTYNL